MHKVLSSDLWLTIKATAKKAKSRQCAVAYVTQDLIGFSAGDVLITNASRRAISNGETDAKLLRQFFENGVVIYNCENLHSKILMLDGLAVVGSANLSKNSEQVLVETAIITDHTSVVSGVASIIEQLSKKSEKLKKPKLDDLCKIPVVKRGGVGNAGASNKRARLRSLGNRTWIVGVRELTRVSGEERDQIEKALETIATAEGSAEDFDWVKWSPKHRFAKEAKEGDSIIQIWRPANVSGRTEVFLPVPVLLKQRTKGWVRVYYRDNDIQSISLARFRTLLNKMGYHRRVGPTSQLPLETEFSDKLSKGMLRSIRQRRARARKYRRSK